MVILGFYLWLRSLFCLPPVSRASLGLPELGPPGSAGKELVYPQLRVVPMGWTHALWWCQAMLQRWVEAAGLSLGPAFLIRELSLGCYYGRVPPAAICR